MGMQRPLHLIDHESEPREIETARPIDGMTRGFVRHHEADHRAPEEEIKNVSEFTREPADRFEQYRDCGYEDDRRRREEQILLDENQRLDPRFAANEQHGHRAEHEADDEGGQEDEVAEE